MILNQIWHLIWSLFYPVLLVIIGCALWDLIKFMCTPSNETQKKIQAEFDETEKFIEQQKKRQY